MNRRSQGSGVRGQDSAGGRRWGVFCFLALLVLGGCCSQPKPRPDLNFSYYHNPEFRWRHVARVLVLPVVNESATPEATDQMRRSLTAELQQLGRFEVVQTPPEVAARFARAVRDGGRFDEAELIDLARCASADVILSVSLSHYSAYFRPRIGLTVQAISPDVGKVVASVDGLWDSNNLAVAERAHLFYVRQRSVAECVRDHVCGTIDTAYADELVLSSPHLFQRYVAAEVSRLLVGDPELLERLRPPEPKAEEVRPAHGAQPARCEPPAVRVEGSWPATPPRGGAGGGNEADQRFGPPPKWYPKPAPTPER